VQTVSVQRVKHFRRRDGDDGELLPDEIEVDSIEDERECPDELGVREFLVLPKGYSLRHKFWTREYDLKADELITNWRRHHPPVQLTAAAPAQGSPAPTPTPLQASIPATPATTPATRAAPSTQQPAQHQDALSPPPTTTTRSGRAVKPPRRLDP
jgi:hypothetical protein